MVKALVFLLVVISLIPSEVFACVNDPIDMNMRYALYVSSLLFLLFVGIVMYKSIRSKKLYRGKLYFILLILFIVAMFFAVGDIKRYLELKDIQDCIDSCSPGKPCLCYPMC